MFNSKDIAPYEKDFKRYILGLLYFLSAFYIASAFLLYFLPFQIKTYYPLFAMLLFNAISIVVTHILPSVYIYKSIKIFLLFQTAAFWPMTASMLERCNTSTLIWFIVIFLFINSVYTTKSIKVFAAVIAVLMLTCAIPGFLRYGLAKEALPPSVYERSWIMHVLPSLLNNFFVLLLVGWSLYYSHRFYQIKINILQKIAGLEEDEKNKNQNINSEDAYKYNKIFASIETYFADKQPYLKADFRISTMANELKINTSYLSKAIQIKRNMNFINFVNYYRLEKAKELMRQNSAKYTLEYIYLSSGFKSQPVFNAIFKAQEGITPSEWCKENGCPRTTNGDAVLQQEKPITY
jgi:AraC-like DNA-binding protein